MEFSRFLEILPKIVKVTLPGEDAHAKMSPPERRAKIRELDFSKIRPRRAAVLMLVYPENNNATLALIQRNEYSGVHSSQIAFPGGKIESFDPSPVFAALRETEEEIGLPRGKVTIVQPFSELYIPPSNFKVSPFLGFTQQTPLFIPDPREVAAMVSMPLSTLLDDHFTEMRLMSTSYSESIEVPVFKVGAHAIWGATAMILSELKEVLKSVS